MISAMDAFFLALQLLTRIPVPANFAMQQAHPGHAVLFFPVIGLLIGALILLAAWLLQDVPVLISAALMLSFWVFLSGGMHLDGLADCADAWIGGLGDKERSLAIMKDSAAGPMAVIVLVLLLLLKWTLLSECLVTENFLPLILAPMAARLAVIGLMLTAPYVRQGGMGEALQHQLPHRPGILVLLLGCLLLGMVTSLSPLLAGTAVVIGIRYVALQRLGGMTGDVYGAAVELVEVTFLSAAVL